MQTVQLKCYEANFAKKAKYQIGGRGHHFGPLHHQFSFCKTRDVATFCS
jgi:hypothetical protein